MSFASNVDSEVSALGPCGRTLDVDSEDRLCRLRFVLALLDEPYRSGLASPLLTELADVDELMTLAARLDDAWIGDLALLSRRFAETQSSR